MRGSMHLKRPFKALPKIGGWFRIVEYITGTKNRMHSIPARDVEDSGDHIHPGARQLFLRLLRERGKASPEVPIGSVQQPQHGVSEFGPAIWNSAWNSRVTLGA